MGTWGVGIYNDDHALDAVADLRESGDPNGHFEQVFSGFLSATSDGFDESEFAGDWAQARAVLALCDVVRLAVVPRPTAGRVGIPNTLAQWLDSRTFKLAPSVIELAATCIQRLLDSKWLAGDYPEYWRVSVAPLALHFFGP